MADDELDEDAVADKIEDEDDSEGVEAEELEARDGELEAFFFFCFLHALLIRKFLLLFLHALGNRFRERRHPPLQRPQERANWAARAARFKVEGCDRVRGGVATLLAQRPERLRDRE